MYVTSEFVSTPKEVSTSVVRRQRILASEGSRELRRCRMEHSIRVSDLKFNERRYHRLLRWLEDVKIRYRRTSQRKQPPSETEKPVDQTIDDRLAFEARSDGSKTAAEVSSSVFITHLPSDDRRGSLEKEQLHYESVMESMRKSLRTRLSGAEPLLRPKAVKYPINSMKRRGSLEAVDKKKSTTANSKVSLLFPLFEVSSLPTQNNRRPLRLSAIPEVDLKEEESAIRQDRVEARIKRNNIKASIPLPKIVTPSSTPRSSRTPVLTPISESAIDDESDELKLKENFFKIDLNSEYDESVDVDNSVDSDKDSNLNSISNQLNRKQKQKVKKFKK